MTRTDGLASSTIDMVEDPERILRRSNQRSAASRTKAGPKATASSKSTVLLTQLAPGGKDAEIVRPVPHEATDEKPLSAGQVNGNLINAEGSPKAYVCLPCLTAIRLFKKNFTVGRGSTTHNELFACLVWPSRGKDGTQCERCVGQGSGPKCLDPLKGLEKDVHALLRLLPDYNRILGENRDVEAKDLAAEDLEKVMAAAAASDKLYYRAHSSQAVRIQRDLKRKRASSDPSSPHKEITALSYSTTDMREAVEKVKKRTVKLSRFCEGELLTQLHRIDNLLKVERERHRWTHKALSKLIEAHNKQADLAESQGLPGSQPLIELEPFNATTIPSFDSDDAFEQPSRETSEDQGDTVTEGKGN
ncbi:hypothetical protein NA56DRAFT_652831 [Hyaloscypha hepaticicola]|uniref:Uncharacterized protein n=1 Tax=Hyaloscypha hepaticicola TaxID=2082293 RepID=A0A2J6PD38_9HELO|nr:hypothetical protein NA56DRAFT_652831 [Hyaloscypha hepaticicola]